MCAFIPSDKLSADYVLEDNERIIRNPHWTHYPGLIHGMTTRAASLRMGKDTFFNAIRYLQSTEILPNQLIVGGNQIHGAHIESISAPIENTSLRGIVCDRNFSIAQFPSTDAFITSLPQITLVLQTADCIPLFLVDYPRMIAGIAHCGWRGIRQRLPSKIVRSMIFEGADPDTLTAWIGPCIRETSYEVGNDLVQQFKTVFPQAQVSTNETHLDLAAITIWQLKEAGLDPHNIYDSGQCTFENAHLYHSYRREGIDAGRMLSFIGFHYETSH